MLDLVHMPYSPWSERARWALDHHGLSYRLSPYTPMLGELPLRLRLRRFSGKVTVPVLLANGQAITDSTDIARYADRVGRGSRLFPDGRDADVQRWVARADRAMAAGRNLVTRRTGRSREARAESLPRALRGAGTAGDILAQSGVEFFMWKYGLRTRGEEGDVSEVATVLDALRDALGGRATLFEAFSFADIAAGTTLQVVEPVSDAFLPLGPATRAVWATPELRARYADLVEWRDRLYAGHRAKP